MTSDIPLLARAILLEPERILANLERARAAGVVETPPNAWQLALGVLRLWHRSIFRSHTVGTSPNGRVRSTWRARLLENRAVRLPFLLAEGAVRPLDFTGLAGSGAALITHLVGAHHDGNQFVYDLEILAACHPGALERLRAELLAILAEPDSPRHRFLRDLVVFEDYHEALLAAVERTLDQGGGPSVPLPAGPSPAGPHGGPAMSAEERADPDLSLHAYLRWCAAQPSTPAATWAAIRAGRFRLDGPLEDASPSATPVTARWLRGRSRAELAELLARGEPMDPDAIAGWTYRGVSLGLPAAVERLTWKKFAKTFVRDPATGAVRGWNVRVRQDGDLDGPVCPLRRGGRDVTFGPFTVRPDDRGVVLDYGETHGRLHPMGRLRDPLVAVNRGSAELLLGRTDLAFGGARLPTPSYFTLERDAPAG